MVLKSAIGGTQGRPEVLCELLGEIVVESLRDDRACAQGRRREGGDKKRNDSKNLHRCEVTS